MTNANKNVILHALLEGIITDLYPKTVAGNVYVDATTTIDTKLNEIAGQFEEYITEEDANQAIKTAVNALKSELMGGDVADAYDTFKEIANYITENETAYNKLNQLVNAKLDKTEFETFQNSVEKLGTLAGKDEITEAELGATLKAKLHTHENLEVLNGITTEKVSGWDGKSKVYYAAEQPGTLGENDLWVEVPAE